MMPYRKAPLYVALLWFVLVVPIAQARQYSRVAVFGEYTNVRHTEEHSYGCTVQLWKENGRLLGFLLVAGGLSGDTPTGRIENVRYDARHGSLYFTAKLSTGLRYDGRRKTQIFSHDLFTFDGVLVNDSLSGSMFHQDALAPKSKPTSEHVILRFSSQGTNGMEAYPSRAAWTAMAQRILKFRGPQWQ